MKPIAGRVFFTAISVLYPLIVYCGLEYWALSPRRLSLLLLAIAFFHFLNFTRSKSSIDRSRTAILLILVFLCAFIAFFLDNIIFVKIYPVLISLSLLAFFGFTLWRPPNIIFRMASLWDKSLKNSPSRRAVELYCRKVTLVWCSFFIFNAIVASFTVFKASDRVWSLYNGLISYILMGVIFIVEYLVRRMVQNKLQSYVPVCNLEVDSRPEGAPVSFGSCLDN